MLRKVKPSTVQLLGKTSSVQEFGSMEHLDAAEATIEGRYPEFGYSLNRESDMIVRVLSGSGTIVSPMKQERIKSGSIVFIEKETPYYYDGQSLRIFMVSSPPWSTDQYEHID